MSAFESILLGLSLKATVVLLVAAAVRPALRRASAATRHLVMALALFGLLLLPLLSSSLPVWQLAVLPPSAPAERPLRTLPLAALDDGGGVVDGTFSGRAVDSPAALDGPSKAAVAAADEGGHGVVTSWLAVMWLLGAGVVLGKFVAGLLRMRWVVCTGERVTDPAALRILDDCAGVLRLRDRPRLISSGKVDVPLVWGWLRPAVVVPPDFVDWHPAAMRAVMLHELGHLKRVDWPILLLGRCVVALYWFHPLAWLLDRWVKQDCERACDDIVVTRGTKPSDYASHLLSIAHGIPRSSASVKAALAVVRRSQVNTRLRSILDPLLSRRTPSRLAVTGLIAALLLILVPLASMQIAQSAYADEPKPDKKLLFAQQKHEREAHEDEANVSEGKRLYEQGYELYKHGLYEKAAQSFEGAVDAGFRSGASMYNVACCRARIGDAAQAMSWLERAMEAGYDDPTKLVEDSDFDPIREDAGFQGFIDRAFEQAGRERRFPEHYPYRAITERFHELEDSGSTDGQEWHHIGSRLLGMGRVDLAIEAYTHAVEQLGEGNSSAMYNLACAYSVAGQTGAALEWLDRSVEAGFDNIERFLNDPDLDNVRNDAGFEPIMKKSEFLSLSRFKKSDLGSTEPWTQAVEEYRAYVRDNASSGRGWFDLGWALHTSKSYGEAAEAFGKAAALGFRPAASTYNVACADALMQRTDAALDALERAVDLGMKDYGQIEQDEDLASLREEPRFQALLAEIERDKKVSYEEKMQRKYKQKMKLKDKSVDPRRAY